MNDDTRRRRLDFAYNLAVAGIGLLSALAWLSVALGQRSDPVAWLLAAGAFVVTIPRIPPVVRAWKNLHRP